MQNAENTLVVNVNVEISAKALETIVETAKQMTGRNEKGHYRVDTAAKVGEMISRFMDEKNFDSFVENADNYG